MVNSLSVLVAALPRCVNPCPIILFLFVKIRVHSCLIFFVPFAFLPLCFLWLNFLRALRVLVVILFCVHLWLNSFVLCSLGDLKK